MNNLTYQDLFFVKNKIQQSFRLSQSPTSKSKNSLHLAKLIQKSSTILPVKERMKNSQKITSQQNLDDWMIKKQLQVKKFINMKNIREQEFNDEVKTSEKIKFRNKQDWVKLRLIKQNVKSFEIKETQVSNVFQEIPTQKKFFGIHNRKPLLNERQPQPLFLSESQNYCICKEKKLSDKFESIYSFQSLRNSKRKPSIRKFFQQDPQKCQQQPEKNYRKQKKYISILEKSQGKSLSIESKVHNKKNANFTHFIQPKTLKQTKQCFIINDKKIHFAINKTVDLTPKSFSEKMKVPSLLNTIQPLKSYTYRQMQPQEQNQLKTKFRELDNRLEQILKSARDQKVFK